MRLKGLVLGFHFDQMSPCRRAPSSRILVSFSGTAAARGLVVTTEYNWDLLRNNLLCKCMGLVFAMGQDFLRKLDFIKKINLEKKTFFCAKKLIVLSFGDIFTFPNAYDIRPNLGTKELLRKNCAREYGLLAKRITN